MKEKLYDTFIHYIHTRLGIGPDDRLLLAVSGGVDSMVMADLFSRTDHTFAVAHCNFSLRGAEADEDDTMVEQYCGHLGVSYHYIRFDTEKEAAEHGESIEMACRRLRYHWFDSLCREFGYTKTAIAHHSDDSVETFFINLIRGTGLRGLTGIHAVNGRVVRPLLFANRREILDYAHFREVPFREDSSNLTTKYLRNKLRLGVIPRIREISPAFGATMTSNVERLTATLCFVERQMELLRESHVQREDGTDVIDPARIDPGLPLDFVLHELLRPYGFPSDTAAEVVQGYRSGKSGLTFYASAFTAFLDRGRILVRSAATRTDTVLTFGDEETTRCTPFGILSLDLLDRSEVDSLRQPSDTALLDADKITFPLSLRRWSEGDRFVPLGMQGRKRVSDFLVDEKVALPDKHRQAVLLSAGEIVWLVGRRIDDRYKVTDATERVYRITIGPHTGSDSI